MVLLHGFGGDLNNWLFTTPALAAEHAVYALDLPGHGGSAKDVGAGDVAALADAVERLLESQSLERVHLVGHSLGGLVAAALAGRGHARVAHADRARGARVSGQPRLHRRLHRR